MKKIYSNKLFPPVIQLVIVILFAVPTKAQEQYFTDETDSRIPQMVAVCSTADAADIDNDGDIDVVGKSWIAIPPYISYFLLLNDGYGYFTQPTEEMLPDTAFLSCGLGFGDVDNDNDYDLYVVSEHYQDLLFINNGSGFFSDETFERLPPLDCGNVDFVFGDFSGDSFCDIITICCYTTGLNHYLLNDGFGYFDDITDLRMPVDTLFDGYGETADLDNDLDLDLLLAWFSDPSVGHIRGLENIDGYFTHFEEGRMDDRISRWIDVADIDNDGDLDIVISGSISLGILINENGFLIDESEERLPDFNHLWGSCGMIGLGDYDNDGDMDIYAGFGISIEDHLFINDGQGYFELADERIPNTRASTRWPEPFDADGDGDLDIFLGCTGDCQQRILINHSTPDTILPRIIAEDLPLGVIDSAAGYWLKVSAYDNISVEKGALAVNIFYRINGSDFINDTLVHCGGTIFSCFIPGQPPGTQVDYYIEIKDKMNNFITTPPEAPDLLHSFTVSYPSDINEKKANSKNGSLRIYPNPSNSEFSVSYFADENLKVSVYDLSGRKLHSEFLPFSATNRWQKWRWSGWNKLATGIYFIELSGVNRKEVKKALLIR